MGTPQRRRVSGHLRSLEVLVWVGPARTWKPDYSRRWEMNWLQIKLLVHTTAAFAGLIRAYGWHRSWALAASVIGHLTGSWALQAWSAVSTSPPCSAQLGGCSGSLSCMLVCIGPGMGSDILLPRPAGPGELHTGRSDGFTPVPGSAGFTEAAARTSDAKPGLHTGAHLTESLLPAAQHVPS